MKFIAVGFLHKKTRTSSNPPPKRITKRTIKQNPKSAEKINNNYLGGKKEK